MPERLNIKVTQTDPIKTKQIFFGQAEEQTNVVSSNSREANIKALFMNNDRNIPDYRLRPGTRRASESVRNNEYQRNAEPLGTPGWITDHIHDPRSLHVGSGNISKIYDTINNHSLTDSIMMKPTQDGGFTKENIRNMNYQPDKRKDDGRRPAPPPPPPPYSNDPYRDYYRDPYRDPYYRPTPPPPPPGYYMREEELDRNNPNRNTNEEVKVIKKPRQYTDEDIPSGAPPEPPFPSTVLPPSKKRSEMQPNKDMIVKVLGYNKSNIQLLGVVSNNITKCSNILADINDINKPINISEIMRILDFMDDDEFRNVIGGAFENILNKNIELSTLITSYLSGTAVIEDEPKKEESSEEEKEDSVPTDSKTDIPKTPVEDTKEDFKPVEESASQPSTDS